MNWKLYEPETGGFAPAKLQSNSKIPKKTISNNTVNKVFVPLKMICKDAAIEYGWGATFNPFYVFKLFAAAHMDTRLEKSWSGLPGNETDPA